MRSFEKDRTGFQVVCGGNLAESAPQSGPLSTPPPSSPGGEASLVAGGTCTPPAFAIHSPSLLLIPLDRFHFVWIGKAVQRRSRHGSTTLNLCTRHFLLRSPIFVVDAMVSHGVPTGPYPGCTGRGFWPSMDIATIRGVWICWFSSPLISFFFPFSSFPFLLSSSFPN